ncbi:MAG: NAD(P)-binding domain-containing protein [Bdellovibrionales bacterium]|nr:NAD(P)-binding domain-containing protein [Bdellovibrionales bacterium]
MSDMFCHLNYGFIGTGSICQACLQGFLHTAKIPREKIFLSSRTPIRLKKIADRFSVQPVSGNEELITKSQIVFLCIKPKDLVPVVEPLASQFNRAHTIVSFLAGVPLNVLQKLLPNVKRLVRMVPNTPASVGEGLFAYSLVRDDPSLESFVQELFSPLGVVLKMKETQLSAFTVSASSGVAFVLELMQYWNEWLENHHFSVDLARQISLQTFLGAALWAKAFPNLSLMQMQSRVASKKGMTMEGLEIFRKAQLDSILHYGFEKAALREKKLFDLKEGK